MSEEIKKIKCPLCGSPDIYYHEIEMDTDDGGNLPLAFSFYGEGVQLRATCRTCDIDFMIRYTEISFYIPPKESE